MNDPKVFENPCAICRVRPANRYCDYVIRYNNSLIFVRGYENFVQENSGCKHETCDLPMCEKCAKHIGGNVDFCPHHYRLYRKKDLPKRLQKAQLRQKAKIFKEMYER